MEEQHPGLQAAPEVEDREAVNVRRVTRFIRTSWTAEFPTKQNLLCIFIVRVELRFLTLSPQAALRLAYSPGMHSIVVSAKKSRFLLKGSVLSQHICSSFYVILYLKR